MKRILLALMVVLVSGIAWAAPDNSVSVLNSFSPNTTIESSKVNQNFNEIQSKFNAHTHEDITEVGAITSGSWNATNISSTYGGTGQNMSASSAGSMLYFESAGVFGELDAGTDGQFLKYDDTLDEPVWATGGSADDAITRGFEIYTGPKGRATIAVMGGQMFHGSTSITTSAAVTLTFATASDWYDSKSAEHIAGADATWCYIGVGSEGKVRLLGNNPPNAFSIDDATGPYVHCFYYKHNAGSHTNYWRVLGAVPLDGSYTVATQTFQTGNTFFYEPTEQFYLGAANTLTELVLPDLPPRITSEMNFGVEDSAGSNIEFRPSNSNGCGRYRIGLKTANKPEWVGWIPIFDNITDQPCIDYAIDNPNTASGGFIGAYRVNIR